MNNSMCFTQKCVCPNGQEVLCAALLMLRSALSLELKGMTRHGESAYMQTKRLFLIKGNKLKVYDQLTEILIENKILIVKRIYVYVDSENYIVYANGIDSAQNASIKSLKRYVLDEKNFHAFVKYYELKFHPRAVANAKATV